MATVSKMIYASPECRVDLAYDNVAMRAISVTVEVFPGMLPTKIILRRDSDKAEFGKTFFEGTETITFPPGAAGRIDLSFNERGGLNGYSIIGSYPSPDA